MNEDSAPRALVVHESWFGNTAILARAVVAGLTQEGLRVTCVPVSLAPRGPLDVDLLVTGGPTHAFGLSRQATRAEAIHQGAADVGSTFAMREWLDQLPEAHGVVFAAVFDTRVGKVRRVPFSAARAERHRLMRHGYHLVGDAAGFLVDDTPGPLAPGELERATAWARGVAVVTKDLLALRSASAASPGS